MKHKVLFDNKTNSWDNALPLGNGVFGCMQYYDDGVLHTAMNHYEVYYDIDDKVLPEEQLMSAAANPNPGSEHRDILKRALDNIPPKGEPMCNYGGITRKDAFDNSKTPVSFYATHPQTGMLTYEFSEELDNAYSKLLLSVEEAKCTFSLKKDTSFIEAQTIVAREDCIVTRVCQSGDGMLKAVGIKFEKCRGDATKSISYEQINEKTVIYRVNYSYTNETDHVEKSNHNAKFCGIIRLVDAECKLKVQNDSAKMYISGAKKDFHIITAIFTPYRYSPLEEEAVKRTEEFAAGLDKLYEQHSEYWKGFFEKSLISIPDKFLEHIYYINQYALDCCSGKDGVMKHHACGLNGLWDIKRPTLWGSRWYWDVNIQASFAGVFSSNRLDLAKVFSDGFREYVGLSELFAKDVHSMSGCAGDYPYSFYYCIWPWCAQYLWFLYEYSMDEEYLKNEAYPVFLKICEFFTQLFVYDEKEDIYNVFPDISPEQGPYAHNTTITVSTAKYLFEFTLKAAEILDDSSPLLDKIKDIHKKMPSYTFSKDGMWGVHFNDSPDAPDNMWIRHPSMLMPIFPIGEYGIDSDEEMKQIILNTIDYLEERCEIGIFGGSWIAAAAARMGKGMTALRLLYERGIDHMLRSNGLTAEETDRFINYCLILREPIYYPCMMEFTGEMLAAVNEMLIQSHNGLIRVFPAIPDGKRDWSKAHRHGYSVTSYIDKFNDYDGWDNVRIDKLLAKGAFEISAQLTDGELKYIKVKSLRGGTVKVTSPFMKSEMKVFCGSDCIAEDLTDNVASFDTVAGEEYIIAEKLSDFSENIAENEDSPGILEHMTYTKHKIYIGENKESLYQKQLNSFIRDRYLGNSRVQNHTVYKFDFTENDSKPYGELMPRQAFAAEERTILALQFVPVTTKRFDYKVGYGFITDEEILVKGRGGPDLLRQDFVEGEKPCRYVIEVPRGFYELLVISGDEEEESITHLSVENGRSVRGETTSAGEFRCTVLPVVLEKDGAIKLDISTEAGHKWKINAVMLNIIRGY